MTDAIFIDANDPDAFTGAPPIVQLSDGQALRAANFKAIVGVRSGGVEDMLLVLRTDRGAALFVALTPITARTVGNELITWANGRDAFAGDAASAALRRAREAE